MGKNLRIGYLDQYGDVLEPTRTVLDEAMSVNQDLSQEKIRNLFRIKQTAIIFVNISKN